jgi:hypothetical protein
MCWVIFHATVTLKWVGAGLLALASFALMVYNRRRIRAAAKA